MKKCIEWKIVLPIGIVCILSSLFQSGVLKVTFPVAVFVPYLAFCICSFIICNKLQLLTLLKILLIGFVCLPIFDYVSWMISSFLPFNLISAVAVAFLRLCVYIAALILVNAWICRKKSALSGKMYILLAVFSLVYAIFNGVQEVALSYSVKYALEQGSLFGWMPVFDTNYLLPVVSELVFYACVFCASVKFFQKD